MANNGIGEASEGRNAHARRALGALTAVAVAGIIGGCGARPDEISVGFTDGTDGGPIDSRVGLGKTALESPIDPAFCRSAATAAAAHYEGFRAAYTDPTEIPRSFRDGSVHLVGPDDWTSGFPAGSFWWLYALTGDAAWRSAAETWTAALEGQSTRTDTHDIGFTIDNTFGAGYRLTGNPAYAEVVRVAAESLATRYDPVVGAIRSWDWGEWAYPVIIDNMMNLDLLFHATEIGGSAFLSEVAIDHALTARNDHFRPDGSSYHVVDYDPNDGGVIAKGTYQGLNDESAWARGQAWGLYGFTLAYRYTSDPRFVEQAKVIADYYTQHPTMPEDGVPYFDFDAPGSSVVPHLRDASAGAIAASALLELSHYVDSVASTRYRSFAATVIRTLSSSAYRAAPGTNGHFLLLHSVGNFPTDGEVDAAINYADYYYLEALLRCTELE